MNLDFIYKYILFLANHAVTGNSISPAEFNMTLNAANIKLLKRKCGLPEDYRPGQPFTRQSVEVTQVLTDDILPFKIHLGDPNTPYLQVDANGYGQIPINLFYPHALSYKFFPNTDCTGEFKIRQIDVLTDQQFDYVAGSSIRKPTLYHPACNFQDGAIRFLPKNIQRVEFVYVRFPVVPVYDFYISAELEHIYLEPGIVHTLLPGEEGSAGQTSGTVQSLSVELEWNDANKLDCASLILSMLGINQREGALQQFAEMSKATGQ
jgi:hypothetical protein